MVDQQENYDTPLSESGQIRRREILRLALAATRRRRDQRRATIAAVVAVVVLVPAAFLLRRQTTSAPNQVAPHQVAIVRPHPDQPSPQTPSAPTIPFVQSDPHIVQRLAVAPQSATWQTLSDDQLLTRLSDIGQPGALTTVNGQPTLILLNPQPKNDGI